jgi:hypothetical protein
VSLAAVRTFSISRDVVEFTEKHLRRAGSKGYELFVFWTGVIEGDRFEVRHGHVPHQTARKTRHGLSVEVGGDALHQLNVWLYENSEVLGAQVHAHPTTAFHSDTDDTFPIVTTLGGLSLVAADFCRHGLLAHAAAFRLGQEGWIQSKRPLEQLVVIG